MIQSTIQKVQIQYLKQFKNEAIDASGSYVVPIPDAAVAEHTYFNDLIVINTSGSLVEIKPDHSADRSFYVPAKSNFIWSSLYDNFRYSFLEILEKSAAAVAANEIQVIISRKELV